MDIYIVRQQIYQVVSQYLHSFHHDFIQQMISPWNQKPCNDADIDWL